MRDYADPTPDFLTGALRGGFRRGDDPAMLTDESWTPQQKDRWSKQFAALFAAAVDRAEAQNKREATQRVRALALSRQPLVLRDVVGGVSQGLGDLGSLGLRALDKTGVLSQRPGDDSLADTLNRQLEEEEAAYAKAGAPPGSVTGTLQTGVRGAARSITTAVPLAATGGGAPLVIGGFAASRANQAMTEATDAGLTGSERAGYVGRAAVIEGGVAGAFQLVGAGGAETAFTKLFAGGVTRTSLKAFLGHTAAELTEENLTEILDANNQAQSKITGPVTSAQRWETFKQTTVTTLLTMGALGGAQALRESGDQQAAFVNGLAEQYGWTQERAEGVVDRAAKRKGDMTVSLGRELEDEARLSPVGLATWFTESPENAAVARALAERKIPSRTEWAEAGFPDRPKEDRERIAAQLQRIVAIYDGAQPSGQAAATPAQPSPLEAGRVPAEVPLVQPTAAQVEAVGRAAAGVQPPPAAVPPAVVTHPAEEPPAAPVARVIPRPGGPLTNEGAMKEARKGLTPEQQAQAEALKARVASRLAAEDEGELEADFGAVPDQRVKSKGIDPVVAARRRHEAEVTAIKLESQDWKTADAPTLAKLLKGFKVPKANHAAAVERLDVLENPIPEGADWRTADVQVLRSMFKAKAIRADERKAAEEHLSDLVYAALDSGTTATDLITGKPSPPQAAETPPAEAEKPKNLGLKEPVAEVLPDASPVGERPVEPQQEKPAAAEKPPVTEPSPAAEERKPAEKPKAEAPAWTRNLSDEKKKRAAEAEAKIRERVKKLIGGKTATAGAGLQLDGELLSAGVDLTALYLEGNARNFAEYVRNMIATFDAPELRPYFRTWWNHATDEAVTAKELDEAVAAVSKPEAPKADLDARARAVVMESTEATVSDGTVNRAMKKLAEDFGITEKAAQEKVEAQLVEVAREIVTDDNGEDERQRFDRLVALYQRQPLFGAKTGESIDLQAYSTPVPMAYAASLMAGVRPGLTVYEPTAGNGALTIGADRSLTHVNELGALRRTELGRKGYRTVTGEDATAFTPKEKFDRVLANPPFKGAKKVWIDGFPLTKIEHQIAAKALGAMKDDGVATLILAGPGPLEADRGTVTEADRIFFNYLLNNYYVAANYEVNGDLYERQGAGWPVRLVVVAGRRKTSLGKQQLAPESVEFIADWPELWDKLPIVEANVVASLAAREVESGVPVPVPAPPAKKSRKTKPTAAEETPVAAPKPPPEPPKAPPPEKPPTPAAGPVVEGEAVNARQSAYVTASRNPFKLGTIVSTMLAPGTAKALTKLQAQVGDVDAYLVDKLEYEDEAELWKALAAEQIDGVALAIYNMEHGKSLIIGDQTGIGKGRQAAAIMYYAKSRGYVPIFMTADPKLFSDMYADTLNIGKTISPLLLGDTGRAHIREGVSPVTAEEEEGDEEAEEEVLTSKVIVPALSTAKQDVAATAHVTGRKSLKEQGYDAVFLPYSQLQTLEKGTGLNSRHRLLESLAKNDKVMFVLDESHRAAGEASVVGAFMRGGTVTKGSGEAAQEITFPGVMNEAGVQGAVYLSATFAKRPGTMPLYFLTSLGQAAEDPAALMDAFQAGGVALQQWASSALGEGGEMIRRERDFAGVRFDTKTITRTEPEKQAAIGTIDRVAEALRGILNFSRLAKAAIEGVGGKGTNDAEKLMASDFASGLINYVAQVLLSTKVDAAVAEAVASHKAGEATVIVLSNTMESFLTDFAAENELEEGDAVNLSYGDVLKRALDRTMRSKEKSATGWEPVQDNTPESLGLEEEYAEVLEVIDGIRDLQLPSSPIDAIHAKLRAAGLRTGELTGREHVVDHAKDGPVLRRRTKKEIDDKGSVVNAYQRGDLDVVILNSSGSTGISLHASEENPEAGQRPRHMVIAQPDLNIDVVKQALGRILRTGMAGEAKDMARYTLLSSPVEAERRPFAVLAAKLASLNANTTADAADDVKVASLDFLNKYGDRIVADLLAEDTQLARDLNIDVTVDDDGDAKANAGIAKKATGRMAVLPNERQREFYEQVTGRYEELVKELKEAGQYDLEVEVQEKWDAQLLDTSVLEAAEDPGQPFLSGLAISKWSIEDPRKPMTKDEVRGAFAKQFGTDDTEQHEAVAKEQIAAFYAKLEAAEAKYLGEKPDGPKPDDSEAVRVERMKRVRTYEEKAERVTKGKGILKRELDALAEDAGKRLLVTVRTGEGSTITEQVYPGVLIGLSLSMPKVGNPWRPSLVKAVVAVEHPRRTVTFAVSRLADSTVEVRTQGGRVPFDVESFGRTMAKGRAERMVYTGNLIRALGSAGKGQITTFRTHDGEAVTGLVMPAGWKLKDAKNDPRLSIRTGEAAVKLLESPSALLAGKDADGKDKAKLRIRRMGYRYEVRVALAKSKGSRVYLDKGLAKIVVGWVSAGDTMKATLDEKALAQAVDYMIADMKFSFTAVKATVAQVAEAHGEKADLRLGAPEPKEDEDEPPPAPSGGKKLRGDIQAVEVMNLIRHEWKVEARGAATFKRQFKTKRALGWYTPVLGEMRLQTANNVVTAIHELGHHFDRELDNFSKRRGHPIGVEEELLQLGVDLYGPRKPKGGYKTEGFAEFVREYVLGRPDLQERAPTLYRWWTTEYLPGDPEEARKIAKLTDAVQTLLGMTSQEAIDAFQRPTREDFSVGRILSTVAATVDQKLRDALFPLWRAMQATGADLEKVEPEHHPVLLATAYARTAGGRTEHAALEGTYDLGGDRTGASLRQVLGPVLDRFKEWKDYMIARRAIERYHDRGLNPGISRKAVEEIRDAHESKPGFRETATAYTEWAHRALRPLVESGRMTEEEYRQVVDDNPLYFSMSRRFEGSGEGSGGGDPINRVRGNTNLPIHDPIDAMLAQYEKIQQVAMQHDVMRAAVHFYDAQKRINARTGSAETFLGGFLTEIPAATEAVEFSAEQLRAKITGALREGLGDEQQAAEVEDALESFWGERMTVFRARRDAPRTGAGEDPAVAIVVNGKRRFFQVKRELLPILEGVAHSTFIPGRLGALVRGATSLTRLGAVGLNLTFGLISNTARDAVTGPVNADYSFQVPFLSTAMGMVMKWTGSEHAKRYMGFGLGTVGRVGQDRDAAARLSQRVEKGSLLESVAAGKVPAVFASWRHMLDGIQGFISQTEFGPRIVEFAAAFDYGMKKWKSRKSATILAAAASKDLTLNYTRAGEWGRQANEVVPFFNSGAQGIDKLARSLGVFEPAPWAKVQGTKGRIHALQRTATRSALLLTTTAFLLWLKHRDDDDWKELPPHEKWGYLHVYKLKNKQWIRLPLPFEVGAIFGALPIAALEEFRSPGALHEAMSVAFKNATPVDFSSLHGFARSAAIAAPVVDVLANKDWKGDPILTTRKDMLAQDKIDPRTTDLARHLARYTPGNLSPIELDHILNGYTGGLWKRVLGSPDMLAAMRADDPSSWPVIGVLATRPHTSRLVAEFYDRTQVLKERKGSNVATLEELGELALAERADRDLDALWEARRGAVASDKPKDEIAREAGELLDQAQDRIRAHLTRDKAQDLGTGLGNIVYGLTDPFSVEKPKTAEERATFRAREAKAREQFAADQARLATLAIARYTESRPLAGIHRQLGRDRRQGPRGASGVTEAAALEALRAETRRRGGNVRVRDASGALTAFGRRQARLLRGLRNIPQ